MTGLSAAIQRFVTADNLQFHARGWVNMMSIGRASCADQTRLQTAEVASLNFRAALASRPRPVPRGKLF
jgi:hypothetical protein